MDSSDLIRYFRTNNIRFRIEVEGKESDLIREGINFNYPDSIVVLEEDANKRGVEYRLYFNGNIPNQYEYLVRCNSFFHTDIYKNIINNNALIKDMLKNGCHFGNN